MDRTVVLAVALGLGSLLLWSLMILVEDMSSTRRNRGSRRPDRESPPQVEWADDDRFEQLVDNWFGPDEPRREPERRSA